MGMSKEMLAKQRAYTASLTRTVQDILGDPTLTPKKQAESIKKLDGASKQNMFEFLNKTFRVGPDLADSIKAIISKDRPRGGPSMDGLKKRLKGSK